MKTRLQSELGEQGCYELHQRLVTHTIETAVESEIAPVEVWHTGDLECSFWQDKQRTLSIALKEQNGSDLGARMLNAMASHLLPTHLSPEQGSKTDHVEWVILIGSDCPQIDKAYLEDAASALESGEEIVLGPAEDGGYVLIGLRKAHKFLFEGISWGTDSVCAATRQRSKENNCPIYCLPERRDLDVAADLAYYQTKFPWTNSVS